MKAATLRLAAPACAGFVRTETVGVTEVAAPLRKLAAVMAAPFVAAAFALAFPFVGLAVLAWVAVRALLERRTGALGFVRNVVLFAVAPFVGLAYALAFPFVGLGMVAWTLLRKEPAAA